MENAHAREVLAYIEAAISALESERRAAAGASDTVLDDGVLIRSTADGHRFRFRCTGADRPPAIGPIVVRSGELRTSGTLDLVEGDAMVITVRHKMGRRPGRTEISADVAFLIQGLQAHLHAIAASSDAATVIRLHQILGLARIDIPGNVEPPPTGEQLQLNAEQTLARDAALARDATWILGPPGTGKTTVIGATASGSALRGERVLVVAPTNVAIDTAIRAVLGHVTPEELGSPDSILRAGPAVDLTADEERRVGARVRAERAMPRSERPSVLRAFREHAVEVVALLETLVDAPDPTALDAWCGSAQRRTARLARAIARASLALDDGSPRARAHMKAARGQFAALLRRILDREAEAPALLAVRHGLLELRLVVGRADQALELLGKWLDERERELIAQARIVGATLARMIVTRAIFAVPFDMVIIDEASMVNVPHVFAAAAMASKRVVIVGDPRQLAPIAATQDRTAKVLLETDIFEKAGLLAALDERRDDPRLIMLVRQYRMHPFIARAASNLSYGGRLKTDKSVRRRTNRPLPFLARGSGRAAIIDTSSLAPRAIKALGTHSRINLAHAASSAAVVAHLIAAGYAEDEIAVVTPHAAHARLVRALVRDAGFAHVLVCTVHRVQSAQREAVVLDIADAPPSKVSQLIRPTVYNPADRVRRLLNVAITRPQETLLVVANWGLLKNECPPGTPLRRLFREPGFSAPFTEAVELIRTSPLAKRVTVAPGALLHERSARPWLLVNRADTPGLLRVLHGLPSGARIVYRAEGQIGRDNQRAVSTALEGDARAIAAVGVDALLTDMLIDDKAVTSFASPPWHSSEDDRVSVTIYGEAVVEELTRALRLTAMGDLESRGLLGCRGCGAPLTLAVRRDALLRACGCRLTDPGTEIKAELRVGSCV